MKQCAQVVVVFMVMAAPAFASLPRDRAAELQLALHPLPPRYYMMMATNYAPVVFFTDIISGPGAGGENGNGVYVHIYGRNFGPTRGTSTVKIGGGLVAAYTSWCAACSNAQLGPASGDKMDVIVVEVGGAAVTGEVVVTVNGVPSANGPTFTVRSGNIYCVKATGADSAGHGTFAAGCFLTVKYARDNASGPGFTIYDYDVDVVGVDGQCSSLMITSANGGNGTQANPNALVAYPGRRPTIGDLSGTLNPNGTQGTPTGACNGYNDGGKTIATIGPRSGTSVPVATTAFDDEHASVRGARQGDYVIVAGTANYNRVMTIASITRTCTPDADHCYIKNLTLTDTASGTLAQETTGTVAVTHLYYYGATVNADYWTLAGFNARGASAAFSWQGNGGRHVDMDVSAMNDGESACLAHDGTGLHDFAEFGLKMHDCGFSREGTSHFAQGEYFANGGSYNIEQGWGEVGGNMWICAGLQNNPGSRAAEYAWKIHDFYLHDIRCVAINDEGANPSLGAVQRYNNILINVGVGPTPIGGTAFYGAFRANFAVGISPTPSGTIQYRNNTVVNAGNISGGCPGGSECGVINHDDTSYPALLSDFQNNLIIQTAAIAYLASGTASGTYNHCYGNGACPGAWTNSTTGDASFVVSYSDVHLTLNSPAAVKASGHSTGITLDHDGITRGTAIGAYEPGRTLGSLGPGSAAGGSVK